MNKSFKDLCVLVEQATLYHISPSQAQLEFSRISPNRKVQIREKMWSFAKGIDSKKYVFKHAFVVLATYAAVVADDFSTNANIVLLVMLANPDK